VAFKAVDAKTDFVALERRVQEAWDERGTMRRYLEKNRGAPSRFRFMDGPITANNPMGVHHAWGRTYKDVIQRYHTMLGDEQRYQNGFDCQGLWVEVEVEKELGLKSKRDIERYGMAEFVQRCKERVLKYAAIQTAQSIRLGYWMDWDHSYYTMSDENNYTIWLFLKRCHEQGWIYKGHDVMPWCPRCGTGISQHEIVTEGYKDIQHMSLYVKLPLAGRPGEHLLVWTTTPWTLSSNVAAAVNPDLEYARVRQGEETYYLAAGALGALKGPYEELGRLRGSEMLGWGYEGPFDELPAEAGVRHTTIPWAEVSAEEGTGIVHIAPGCGQEDYALSKEHGLDVVAPLDEFGVFLPGFGPLSGKYVGEVGEPIADDLRAKGKLYRAQVYAHRYPVCWRCGTDLVFRLVDEWFISMEELRPRLMRVTEQIEWLPSYGKERELDWLRNMHDWMISKKRYWGLALPIYECGACGKFEVIGSEDELRERAVEGWDRFEGHTPHRPWVDEVKIACSGCGERVGRVPDVGNPWLDAGIVPFSTLGYRHDRPHWEGWFPADFITESFPGQFRNWFYSLITMATALEDRPPARTVLGFQLMRDEHGEEMHKSKGNAIWFEDGADRMGVDVMRWLFCAHNPTTNLNFGYGPGDEVRRRFLLPLWNSYSFFVTYANLDGYAPGPPVDPAARTLLDRWALSRLNTLVGEVRDDLLRYDMLAATRRIERFTVDELSNWYIRRNRRRFWKSEDDADKAAAYDTLHACLLTLSRLVAPMMPFIAEEMYGNLARSHDEAAPESVHLTAYPDCDAPLVDAELESSVEAVMRVVELGRAARNAANLKVRQPLARALVKAPTPALGDAVRRLQDQALEELNVKELELVESAGDLVEYSVLPRLPVLGPKYGKRLPKLRAALAALDPREAAARALAGEPVELEVDGESVRLSPEELLIEERERPGLASVSEGGYVVALDAEITPELYYEGLARDFVRQVQSLRKEAGFDISDRIRVRYEGHEDLGAALARHDEYARVETLADSIEAGEPGDGALAHPVQVGDAEARVSVRRS
jgi:isoleucyl-tRNA synthetase